MFCCLSRHINSGVFWHAKVTETILPLSHIPAMQDEKSKFEWKLSYSRKSDLKCFYAMYNMRIHIYNSIYTQSKIRRISSTLSETGVESGRSRVVGERLTWGEAMTEVRWSPGTRGRASLTPECLPRGIWQSSALRLPHAMETKK